MSIYALVGPDGVGKTTISNLLADQLSGKYVKFPRGSDGDTDEPMYSGLRLRKLLNNKDVPVDPVALQALMFVNKFECIDELNELEYRFGRLFFDRWTPCGWVYGKLDGVCPEWTDRINCQINRVVHVDLTFLLIGPSHKHDNDIYSSKQSEISELYLEYYRKYADREPIIIIDTTEKTIPEIYEEILQKIVEYETVRGPVGSITGIGKAVCDTAATIKEENDDV